MNTKTVGALGEDEIVRYLEAHRFFIIARNYRCTFGEIDIIAQHDNVISFIEVKLRNSQFLPIGHIVHPGKQQKIIKTARHYLMQACKQNIVYRFDIAYLDKEKNITYIQNAFTASDY